MNLATKIPKSFNAVQTKKIIIQTLHQYFWAIHTIVP
jgi:hypothetical protein